MRILIADDTTQRYEGLVDELEKIGVSRNEIDITSSANGARKLLEDNNYDLLLLDIILPIRAENTELSSRHSLDLLFELTQGDLLNKPSKIIGITGDKSVLNEVEPIFTSSTWNVIEYSNSDDEWIEQIKNCVLYIENKYKNLTEPPAYGVDLVVVCALEKPELAEVLKLDWNWSPPKPIDHSTFVHDGYFINNNKKITVTAVRTPRMGMVSTALLTSKIISLLRPKLIAMCGICAGVKDKVKMGEVLFADESWDYQSGKRVIDNNFSTLSISPRTIPVDQTIRSHVQQIASDKEALAKIFTDYDEDAAGIPMIHLGPIASGSAVLADGRTIKEVKNQHRELIGVEMEIYGLYEASSEAADPKPKAFALKSVCDYAGPEKDDSEQRYAAYTSARVLHLLMDRFAERLLR